MDYGQYFQAALNAIRREGRYRVFADIKRQQGAFPTGEHFVGEAARPITVWCSNDYLGMGQHPAVLAAMHEAIDSVGAGSGQNLRAGFANLRRIGTFFRIGG